MKWMNNGSFEILSWIYKIWKNMMDIDGPIDPAVVDLPPVAKWKLCLQGSWMFGRSFRFTLWLFNIAMENHNF